jgi:hypothetical protein
MHMLPRLCSILRVDACATELCYSGTGSSRLGEAEDPGVIGGFCDCDCVCGICRPRTGIVQSDLNTDYR